MNLRTLLFLSVFAIVSSCATDRDDNINLSQDPQIIDPTLLIAEDSNVFSMLETLSGTGNLELAEDVCIDFIYPFTIKEYDSEGVELNSSIVSSDRQFYILLLSIPEENFINLSFPIEATLDDGSILTIANKEELGEAMATCIVALEEGIIGYCESVVAECAWVVNVPEGVENDFYENSVFTAVELGLNTYYYRGEAYESSWIFYFIENKLHLNIALEDVALGTIWNYDWETEIVGPDEIPIKNADETAYILKKECDEDGYCTTLTFTECEDPAMPSTASFSLEDLVPCIDIIAAPQQDNRNQEFLVDYIFTFHTTANDAEDALNAIDTSTPYITNSASETLYVRIQHPDTSEFLVVAITLVAEVC